MQNGSLTRQATGPVGLISGTQSPSKTFLNALMLQYVKEFEGSEIMINAV